MKRMMIVSYWYCLFACSFESTGTDFVDRDVASGGRTPLTTYIGGGGAAALGGGAGESFMGGSTYVASSLSMGGDTASAFGGSSAVVTSVPLLNPTIELASDTPTASIVAAGSLAVPILRIHLFGDLLHFPVSILQFRDIGSGHRTDLVGVYVYNETTNQRLSTIQPITASTKILAFVGLNISQEATIAFMCDVARTSTRSVTHQFEMTDESYVYLLNNGMITGDFPIRGNPITID